MAVPSRNSRLKIVSALAAVAIALLAIYYGLRNTPTKLADDEAAELVHLKNVALGELENQKVKAGLTSFQSLLARLPADPLAARNIAVANVLSLGEEGKESPTAAQVATARAAIAESQSVEGEAIPHHWLALHVAIMASEREAAETHIAAILKAHPDDSAAWFARFHASQLDPSQSVDVAALHALEEACQLSPENAWFRLEWLRAMATVLRQEPKPNLAELKLPEQLAATRHTIEPFAYVIKTHSRTDVLQLLDEAEQAVAAQDLGGVSFRLLKLANVLSPHAAPDRRTTRRHPLEFVLDDFQPAFYESHPLLKAEAATPISVQFESMPWDQASDVDILDLELVDFDLDGRLDIVTLNSTSLTIWVRDSQQAAWRVLAQTEVQGFSQLLAQDFDADFQETAKATLGQADTTNSRSPALKNGCPSADVDLVLYGAAGILLLENRFDVTSKLRSVAPIEFNQLPGELRDVSVIAATDLESDGDLDLIIATAKGMQLWSNANEWKFIDISSRSTLPDKSLPITQLLPLDWDRDVDIDVLVASPQGAGWLENMRHGQFRWRAFDGEFSQLKTAQAIEALEVDGNASWDLLGATADGLQLITSHTPNSGVVQFATAESVMKPSPTGLLTWDYDNDGFDDVLAWSESGIKLLRGSGSGKFAESESLPNVSGEIQKSVTGDLDGDGDFELAVLAKGKLSLWDNAGGNANHWLDVALQAQQIVGNETAPSGRVSPFGTGSLLELKAGARYQAKVVRGQSTHFGLGQAAQADVVRVVWLNGVPQNILKPAADLFVCEQQILNTSCPYLYTWDGERFVFATDLLWNAPLGLQFAEGIVAQPREWEYLKLSGEQLVTKHGQYELQLTEELWEAAYFDQVKLIAVDHPAETAVYSNEKVGPATISEYKIHSVRQSRSPVAAKNHHDRDLMPEIAKQDGVFARVYDLKLRQGVTEESYLELNLGNVGSAKQITLFLTGWIYPSSTSINVALSQGGSVPPPKPPSLWVPNGQDGWKEMLPFMGFPGGKTKTIAVDLTGVLAPNDGRLRIATTMEIYWDHIFYSVDEAPVEVRTTDLTLLSADLHDRGYSKVVPDSIHHGPEQFIYDEVSTEAKWPPMQGAFTAPGDVLPLLRHNDDRLLTIGAGDEVTLRFAEPAEPLPPGWKRDFMFYSNGWEKDGNLLTVIGETADPQPFHAMSSYPWPADEHGQASERWPSRVQSPAFWKAIQRW